MTEKKRQHGLRSDKRIQVTLVDGRRPDGKPNKLFFYGKTRAEAEAKKAAYLEEKRCGLSHSDRDMTVSEWLDIWIRMYSIDVAAYAVYVKRIRDDFGKRYIRSVREADLVLSLAAYAGKSKSGASKYRMILKQCFHRAYKNHVIPDDPAEDLKLPDTTEGTHRALERWEIDLITDNWSIYPAGRWAMIMLFCGLRRGEMVALDWTAIDMHARTLTVCASASFNGSETIIHDWTKTPAGMRKLPICDPLFAMLAATPPSERVGRVCLSATGKPLTHDTVRKNWNTYCTVMNRVLHGQEPFRRSGRKSQDEKDEEEAMQKYAEAVKHGLTAVQPRRQPDKQPGRTFNCKQHDLRHTFATMLFEAGVEAKDAQYYLGHKDLRMTTELYTHLTEERKNESRSRITGYLDAWLKKDVK